MKRLKDNSDAPEARHGTLPKTYTSSRKRQQLHSTHPRKNGYFRLREQKSRRKESSQWNLELVSIWSARETKQEKKQQKSQRIVLSRDGDAS